MINVFKIPDIVQSVYNNFEWSYPTQEKNLYLTFDDGPCAGNTDWILNTLDNFNAKATFFCVGENVKSQPGLFAEITRRGHAVGNHTYHHINNRKVGNGDYIKDVEKCSKLVQTALFRPPYGRINPGQASNLINKGYRIIMYSILANDYNQKLSTGYLLGKLIKQTHKGAIVVFHDSEKARKNMQAVLPVFLEHFAKEGYQFPIIQ